MKTSVLRSLIALLMATSSAGLFYGPALAQALAVTTTDPTSVTASSATLAGDLTHLGSDNVTISVFFQWGTTTSYDNETAPQQRTATGAFTAAITNLSPNTLYHFRAKAVGASIAYGTDVTFTTAQAGNAPGITTSDAANITAKSATLRGSLSSLGTDNITVTVSFQWGTSISYGSETVPQQMTATGSFTTPLTNLSPGTAYHFRAKAVGRSTAYGTDKTFTTTQAAAPPAVATGSVTDIKTTSAILNGNLTNLGTADSVTVSFQWGTSTSYGNETPIKTIAANGAFSATISNLSPNTVYHFRTKVVGSETTYGSDQTFQTKEGTPPAPPQPPSQGGQDVSGDKDWLIFAVIGGAAAAGLLLLALLMFRTRLRRQPAYQMPRQGPPQYAPQMFPCPTCGTQNPIGQRFCAVCGQQFQYNCPQCGAIVDPGYRSCPNCGSPLNWG